MPASSAHADLLDLLDALCEERLTPTRLARLEALVLTDAAARRLYLEYLHLHGTLLWDAARSDLAGPVPASTTVVPVARTVAGTWRRWRVSAVAAVAVLLLVGVLSWQAGWPQPQGAPLVDAETPAAAPETSTAIVDVPRRPPHAPITLPGRGALLVERANDESLAERPQPPVEARVPRGDPVAAVDADIARGWAVAGIEPAAVAGDAVWLRRVYLDLVGHVPPAAAVEPFLNDHKPDKRGRLVTTLLNDAGFGRNLGTVWTNTLLGRVSPPQVDRAAFWQYLADGFNSDRPWNATAAALVAAEGAVVDEPAANFLIARLAAAAASGAHAGNSPDAVAAAATARLLLGTRIECARCHRHPDGPWEQADFWQLAGFFRGTQIVQTADGVPALASTPPTGPVLFENLNGLVRATDSAFPWNRSGAAPRLASAGRETLAAQLGSGEHSQLATAFVNRVWTRLLGTGFVNPPDDLGPHHPPSHPRALAALTGSFVADNYDVKRLVGRICATQAYQLASGTGGGAAALFAHVERQPLTPEQLYESMLIVAADGAGMHSLATREAWIAGHAANGRDSRPMSDLENLRAASDLCTRRTDAFPAAVLATVARPLTAAAGPQSNGPQPNGHATADPLAELLPAVPLQLPTLPAGGDAAAIRGLYLAALTRVPTPEELATGRRLVQRSVAAAPADERAAAHTVALRELLAELLRSAEFATAP